MKPALSNSPNKIKAFLFDYGGVLTKAGKSGSLRQEVAGHFGIDIAEVKVDDIEKQLQLGSITCEEFFLELNKRHPSETPFSEQLFLASKDEVGSRSDKVLELVSKIRRPEIRVGILSNVFEINAQQLRELGCYDSFDPVILSHEVKMVKPDDAIYEFALETLGAEARETVFVDDNPRNLEPARKLGMFTIHASGEKQLTKAIPAILADKNGIELQID